MNTTFQNISKDEVMTEHAKNNFKPLSTGNRYKMATKAFHQLGDISSDDYDICSIGEENDTYYRGSWVTGFGFFNVLFPKETTRELTEEEKEKYGKLTYYLAGESIGKLKI